MAVFDAPRCVQTDVRLFGPTDYHAKANVERLIPDRASGQLSIVYQTECNLLLFLKQAELNYETLN